MEEVECPACSRKVPISRINKHLDRGCPEEDDPVPPPPSSSSANSGKPVASFFTPLANRKKEKDLASASATRKASPPSSPVRSSTQTITSKRPLNSGNDDNFIDSSTTRENGGSFNEDTSSAAKKQKVTAAGNSSTSRLRAAMPLAERMRPSDFTEMVGQEAMFGPEGVLRRIISSDRCPSMLLWGPAGVGKTTCARLVAKMTKSRFVELSGTLNGVADCKKVFAEAKSELMLTG